MTKRWPGDRTGARDRRLWVWRPILRLVRRTNRFVSEPADIDEAVAGNTAGDRRDVARAASDDLVRLAEIDRPHGRAHFPPCGRGRAGGRAALSRRCAGARLGRPPRGRSGRRAAALALRELKRQLDIGRYRRHDRRLAEARARCGARHRHAGAHFPAGRSCRSRSSPAAASISIPGTAPASASRSDAARSSSAISSACPPTPTTRRWRLRGERSRRGLDDVHRRAYALVGARDPGAELRPA